MATARAVEQSGFARRSPAVYVIDPERLAPGQHHIDREPVQPGPERRLATERRELLPRPDEDVLREVIGFIRIEHAAHQAVDAGDVRAVQTLKGGRVAASRQGYVRRFSIRRQCFLEHLGAHPPGWICKQAKRL